MCWNILFVQRNTSPFTTLFEKFSVSCLYAVFKIQYIYIMSYLRIIAVDAFKIMIKYRYIWLSYFPKYLIWNELKARNICLMCSKLTLNSYVSANSNTNALFACFKSSLNGLTSTNTQWKFVYKMVFLIERSYYWNPFLTPLHNLAKGTKETGKI